MMEKTGKKKIAFFDLDETLISHRMNEVPDSTRRTLKKLQEQGIQVVLSTGRHERELELLPSRNIPFDGYVTLNGQVCRDRNGKAFYESPLDQEDVDRLAKLFREKEIPMIFKEKEEIYINFVNDNVVSAQRDINTRIPAVREYHGADVYQVVVYIKAGEEYKIEKYLKNCKITRWNKNAVDIVPKEGGKGAGIEEYLKGCNLTAEDAMAFGDGPNDMEMLETVSLGICMGNGDDSVKKIADYVTDSVDADGIEKAMLHLGYIE